MIHIAITAKDRNSLKVHMVSPTVQQIAQQNDQFRRGDPNVPGIRVITAGLDHLLKQLAIPPEQLAQLVAQFEDFTEHIDPHGEHDFGAFEFHGHKLFWKLDLYNNDYSMGSDDPAELTKTRRVLTIMLADEY
ncbi:MAG: DUF3768 domain-containing protein [Sulfitobacter sp.]